MNNGIFVEEGTVCLLRCPKCGRENYAPNVVSGICTWCGYDANVDYSEQAMKEYAIRILRSALDNVGESARRNCDSDSYKVGYLQGAIEAALKELEKDE